MATDAATATRSGADDETELGPSPEILAALGYVFNVVGALLLLVLEDNDYVRHHAAQALVVTAVAVVGAFVAGVLGAILGGIPVVGGPLNWALGPGVRLLVVAGFLFLAYKAYSGERYTVPELGGAVESVEDLF